MLPATDARAFSVERACTNRSDARGNRGKCRVASATRVTFCACEGKLQVCNWVLVALIRPRLGHLTSLVGMPRARMTVPHAKLPAVRFMWILAVCSGFFVLVFSHAHQHGDAGVRRTIDVALSDSRVIKRRAVPVCSSEPGPAAGIAVTRTGSPLTIR